MKQTQLKQLKKTLTDLPPLTDMAEYLQSAVLVPLLWIEGEYHFVFEKRAPQIRQGGEVCFPGGKIDATDHSPKMTAIRETCEELGCAKETIELLGNLGMQIVPTGMLVHAYLGIVHEKLEHFQISESEVAEVFTVPVAYFLQNEPELYNCEVRVHPYAIDRETGEREIFLPSDTLNLPAVYHEPWGAAQHKVYVYRYQEKMIWGITAKIIYHLMQQLQAIEKEEDKQP